VLGSGLKQFYLDVIKQKCITNGSDKVLVLAILLQKACEKCLPTGPRSCYCTDCATEALVFFETKETDGDRNTDFHVYILLTSSQLKVRFTSLSLPNSTVMNMEEKCMFLTQH